MAKDEVEENVAEAIEKCSAAVDSLVGLMATCPFETEYDRVSSLVGVIEKCDFPPGQNDIMLAIAVNRLKVDW